MEECCCNKSGNIGCRIDMCREMAVLYRSSVTVWLNIVYYNSCFSGFEMLCPGQNLLGEEEDLWITIRSSQVP